MSGYKGRYKPKNTSKYKGDVSKIIYRSLPERAIMKYFDQAQKILFWNSEDVVIPYLYDVDNKMHRYYMDFYAEIRCNDGIIRKYLFEYKPASKMKPPKAPSATSKSRKKTARYITEKLDYIKNMNKWQYAKAYAQSNSVLFYVINENHVKGMEYFINL